MIDTSVELVERMTDVVIGDLGFSIRYEPLVALVREAVLICEETGKGEDQVAETLHLLIKEHRKEVSLNAL